MIHTSFTNSCYRLARVEGEEWDKLLSDPDYVTTHYQCQPQQEFCLGISDNRGLFK
jgi:hypothetical protein